jgi:acyl carrier protein
MESPPSNLTDSVLSIIADYLDVPVADLKPEKSLEELGADSLDFIEIVFEIEEKFGIKAKEDLPELRKSIHTIGDVLRLTSELVAAKTA